VTGPVHIDHWSTYVITPKISAKEAAIHIQTTVQNDSEAQRSVQVRFTVTSPLGKIVHTGETSSQTISPGESSTFEHDVILLNPKLWDLHHPDLYRLDVALDDMSRIRPTNRMSSISPDQETTSFGIREARFEPETGFWLNGTNLKIKGVCLHHYGGAVGAAVP